MKFSEKWLREFVDPKIDSETLMQQLTMAGLEVDGCEPVCPEFDGLVVAELKSVAKHPDADKLSVCEVDCGEDELLTIVCGANNVHAGMKTVLARVGAKLPGISKLKAVKLKGITSNGMLCAASEIGLGDDVDGIMELSDELQVGQSLGDLIDADDTVIEISLTPNRGDCLSIRGIAREIGVINDIDLKEINIDSAANTSEASRKVKLSANDVCPRYVGRIIENVDATVKSPLWLTEKLRRCGVRSINVVVDITNFVMLEIGQPMHGFDNDILNGDIEVRYSNSGESIKLLDETEYELKSDTLLIADEAGPLAIAGIMGGFDSAVTTNSKNIFLESAFFKPEAIIGEGRQYGLHTDSSHRFERGVDPELQRIAIERASELILQLCGGEAGPVIEEKDDDHLPRNHQVVLRKEQVKRVLGINLDDDFITKTFQSLDMECNYDDNQWDIIPPSHRFDIKIEADLIEELARIYTYDAIPVSFPNSHLKLRPINLEQTTIAKMRELLINRDYQEVITYSFVDPELNKLLNINENTMMLANPISPELAEMRTSLWPGLLLSLQYNLKRQSDRVRLFETGLIFEGKEDLKQNSHIAGLIYGNKYGKQWGIDNDLSDFYDLKADIEVILTSLLNLENIEFKQSEALALHPGQALEIHVDGELVGRFGQLHPQISAKLDLPNAPYLFELNIKNISSRREINYQSVSRFPSVKRDISILLDDQIPFDSVSQYVKKEASELLKNLELFDVYQGEGIEKGKKSLALGLTFQATSSTLKDEEVETIMGEIIDGLHKQFGATLRE